MFLFDAWHYLSFDTLWGPAEEGIYAEKKIIFAERVSFYTINALSTQL
jgi:hypothetical protein